MQWMSTEDRWWNSDVLEAAGVADADDGDDSVAVETVAPCCKWCPYWTAVDRKNDTPSVVDDPDPGDDDVPDGILQPARAAAGDADP